MKRVIALAVMTYLLFFVSSFVSAAHTVHNISIATSYPFNQNLTGEIDITLSDFPVNAFITSNRDHSRSILDFLQDNAAIYECFPEDCTIGYNTLRSGNSLSLDPSTGSNIYGVVVTGSDISIDHVSFDITSDFSAGPTKPLTFTFLEDSDNVWTFRYFTENEYHDPDYGFYQDAYANLDHALGTWTYCNDLVFFETDTVLIGADLDLGTATGFVEIMVFNDVGTPLTGGNNRLLYDPHVVNGVKFASSDGSVFSSGHYFVCAKAYNDSAADYLIYADESSGDHSGFNYPGQEFDHAAASAERDASYALYIQEAFYAGSDRLIIEGANFSENLDLAQFFLNWKYDGDCTEGCFLPFSVSGISQNLTISNVDLSYADTNGPVGNPDLQVYELEEIPSTIDFSGILDVSLLGFPMNESGPFTLFIHGDEVTELDADIEITAAPIIHGIYPRQVPAGIDTTLFADISYDGSSHTELTYAWDFGDGTMTTTSEGKVIHRYTNISEYKVTVTVSVGNLSNTFSEQIFAISPKDYVSIIYEQLSLSLNESLADISTFPTWQQGILKNALDVVASEDELKRIKRKMDTAITDADYLDIATSLQVLDIPRKVFISESYSYNIPLTEDADIESFAAYTGESLSSVHTHDQYVDAVVRFQNEHTTFTVDVTRLSLLRTSGILEDILTTTHVTFTNNFGGDTYLILERPRDQITFNALVREPKSQGGITLFPVSESDTLSIDFYTFGLEETTLFATPDIKYLVLSADINENCNFNLICEEGEDYNVCRSDCKPVLPMILYIILACLIVLILYTIVQVWYDKHYEHQLFPDKNRLHNVLMYISAAENKGMSRSEIKRTLREKGWTSERIEFAVRRANGEHVGLYPIIPFGKFSARKRKHTAQKNPHMALSAPVPHGPPVERMQPVPARGMPQRQMPPQSSGARRSPGSANPGATSSQQQRGGNINKGNSQGSSNKRETQRKR